MHERPWIGVAPVNIRKLEDAEIHKTVTIALIAAPPVMRRSGVLGMFQSGNHPR